MIKRTIVGKWITPDGTPASGNITFRASEKVTYLTENVILVRVEVVVPLDDQGEISVDLPTTDEANTEPSSWWWTAQRSLKGQPGRSTSFELPAGAEIDFTDLVNIGGSL